MGGVPKVDGVCPREFDKAAANALIPGPGAYDAGPARGVMFPGSSVVPI